MKLGLLNRLKPIIWRENKISLWTPIGILNHLISPPFYVLFFAIAFASNIKIIEYQGHTFNYVEFFVPGLIAMQVFSLFGFTFSWVRIDFATNLISVISTSPVGMDAYIIGKYLAMLSVTIVKTAILLLTGFLLTGKMLNMNPLSLGIFFITLILGSLFWTNIGLICGIKVKREDVRDIIYSIVLLPITFLSSVYYDLTTAPLWIRIIGNINPLTYITDLLRATYLDIPIRDYTFLILLITIGAISLIATINALWKVSIK